MSLQKRLPAGWSGIGRTTDEGGSLFVSSANTYRTVVNPDGKLSILLYEKNLPGIRAEARIDGL